MYQLLLKRLTGSSDRSPAPGLHTAAGFKTTCKARPPALCMSGGLALSRASSSLFALPSSSLPLVITVRPIWQTPWLTTRHLLLGQRPCGGGHSAPDPASHTEALERLAFTGSSGEGAGLCPHAAVLPSSVLPLAAALSGAGRSCLSPAVILSGELAFVLFLISVLSLDLSCCFPKSELELVSVGDFHGRPTICHTR